MVKIFLLFFYSVTLMNTNLIIKIFQLLTVILCELCFSFIKIYISKIIVKHFL